MESNNIDEKKLDVLKDLLVTEEHNLEDLKRLVAKSKPFIKIESNTGSIILSNVASLTISEKLIIYLIGVFFSKEMGLNKEVQITSRFISEGLGIPQTSLSGALGEYLRRKIVVQEGNSYTIKYYEIEKQLDNLTKKYLSTVETVIKQEIASSNEECKTLSKKIKPRKKVNKNIETPTPQKKIVDSTSLETEIIKWGLKKEQLSSIFNHHNNSLILLRGFKGISNREYHLKSTLLCLIGTKIYYGTDTIDSSELRQILLHSGVPDLVNLSNTLKRYPSHVIHIRGPIGSTKTSYRLTSLGLQASISLIKDILENTSNFEISFTQRIRKELAKPISIDKERLSLKISEFSKYHSVDEEKLKLSFDFKTDNLRLIAKIKDESRKNIQITALMLLGAILKKVYDIESFEGKTLLKDSHLSYDRLDLLDSSSLYRQFFSKKPKSAMQLTYAGEQKAIKLIKELIDKGECTLCS